jgi:hypothetical protein
MSHSYGRGKSLEAMQRSLLKKKKGKEAPPPSPASDSSDDDKPIAAKIKVKVGRQLPLRRATAPSTQVVGTPPITTTTTDDDTTNNTGVDEMRKQNARGKGMGVGKKKILRAILTMWMK